MASIRLRSRVGAGLMLGALLATGCSASTAPPASSVATAAASSASELPSASPAAGVGELLVADLDVIDQAVRTEHPAPFLNTTEAAWNAKLAELQTSLPTASPDQALIQMASLIGLLDTHLYLVGPSGDSFPIATYRFADGLYVTRAVDPALVGSRIDAIDRMPIATVEAKLRPLIAADNESGELDALGVSGVDPEADRRTGSPNELHGLGIINDPASAAFTLTGPDGSQQTVTLTAVAGGDVNYQLQVSGGLLGDKPDAVAQRTVAVWTRLEPKSKAFIFSVNDLHEDGIPDALVAMDKALTDGSATRVILDLRYARGGSTSAMDGLLAALSGKSAINRLGGLVVLIGREDVSASTAFIAELDKQTKAVFVGEPTPARADNGLDPQTIALPASGWALVIPTFRRGTGDPRTEIAPEIAVPLKATDFFAGRDPALDAALAYRP